MGAAPPVIETRKAYFKRGILCQMIGDDAFVRKRKEIGLHFLEAGRHEIPPPIALAGKDDLYFLC